MAPDKNRFRLGGRIGDDEPTPAPEAAPEAANVPVEPPPIAEEPVAAPEGTPAPQEVVAAQRASLDVSGAEAVEAATGPIAEGAEGQDTSVLVPVVTEVDGQPVIIAPPPLTAAQYRTMFGIEDQPVDPEEQKRAYNERYGIDPNPPTSDEVRKAYVEQYDVPSDGSEVDTDA